MFRICIKLNPDPAKNLNPDPDPEDLEIRIQAVLSEKNQNYFIIIRFSYKNLNPDPDPEDLEIRIQAISNTIWKKSKLLHNYKIFF